MEASGWSREVIRWSLGGPDNRVVFRDRLMSLCSERVYVRSTAVRALREDLLVHYDRLPFHKLRLNVTFVTSHARVAPSERQVRAIMVKNGRGPALRVVAIGAGCLARLCKLASVRVFVTIFANLGGSLELNVLLVDRHLMASAAIDDAMRAQQWKLGLGVVEPVHVRPGPHVVTGFATQRRSVRATLCHTVIELPVMWIVVAARAGHVREAEGKNLVFTACRTDFVAIGASYCRVRAVERVFGVAMLGDGKGRAVEIQDRVAFFAAVLIRITRELVVMRNLMAVRARGKLHFINGVLACW